MQLVTFLTLSPILFHHLFYCHFVPFRLLLLSTFVYQALSKNIMFIPLYLQAFSGRCIDKLKGVLCGNNDGPVKGS